MLSQYHRNRIYFSIDVPEQRQISRRIGEFGADVAAEYKKLYTSPYLALAPHARLLLYMSALATEGYFDTAEKLSHYEHWRAQAKTTTFDPSLTPNERMGAFAGDALDYVGTVTAPLDVVGGAKVAGTAGVKMGVNMSRRLLLRGGAKVLKYTDEAIEVSLTLNRLAGGPPSAVVTNRIGPRTVGDILDMAASRTSRTPLNIRQAAYRNLASSAQEATAVLDPLGITSEIISSQNKTGFVKQMLNRLRLVLRQTEMWRPVEKEPVGLFVGGKEIKIYVNELMRGPKSESVRILLDSILGLKYGTPLTTATKARSSIKESIQTLLQYSDLSDDAKNGILQLADADAWDDLLLTLEREGLVTATHKAVYLAELSTWTHEADHAMHYVFDTRPFLRDLLDDAIASGKLVDDDILVLDAIIKGALENSRYGEVSNAFSVLLEEKGIILQPDQIKVLKSNIIHAWEKSAYQTQRETIKALADDSLFRNLFSVTDGKVKLSDDVIANIKNEQMRVFLEAYFDQNLANDEAMDWFISKHYGATEPLSAAFKGNVPVNEMAHGTFSKEILRSSGVSYP
ncbi:MAG: hypothetical protein HYY61_04300 [Deltaproteobacteria bacterium]|nr:hypothetical protein [Deltaproteobacteria bacterium]